MNLSLPFLMRFYCLFQVLSRAFRNRFVELHFQEIPAQELEIILHQRCEIPLSYSKKMVAVLHELQNMRRSSNVFQVRLQCYIHIATDIFSVVC